MHKQAYIIFTRIPTPNKVKTRLQPQFTGQQASDVQENLLQDLFVKMTGLSKQIDVFVAYSDETKPEAFLNQLPVSFQTFAQSGSNIGQRMLNAFQHVLTLGYKSIVLTGSDIPDLDALVIQKAFAKLQDIVIGPSLDGGYYLIGCRRGIDIKALLAAQIDWGHPAVLQQTLAQIIQQNIALLPPLLDVDYPKDLKKAVGELNAQNRHFSQWIETNSEGIL